MSLFYHDHHARVAVQVAPPKKALVRRAGLVVLRALSSPTLAAIINIAVLYVLLRTMRTLSQAACIIAGEDLFQCLR